MSLYFCRLSICLHKHLAIHTELDGKWNFFAKRGEKQIGRRFDIPLSEPSVALTRLPLTIAEQRCDVPTIDLRIKEKIESGQTKRNVGQKEKPE